MSGRIRVSAKEDRTYQGITFASKREMGEYIKLQALERSGIISELRRQVAFPIMVNGTVVCKYIADFTCLDRAGRLQVYDAKGYATEMFKLKRKLFHAVYEDLRLVEL
jgi:hypothetical protein